MISRYFRAHIDSQPIRVCFQTCEELVFWHESHSSAYKLQSCGHESKGAIYAQASNLRMVTNDGLFSRELNVA